MENLSQGDLGFAVKLEQVKYAVIILRLYS